MRGLRRRRKCTYSAAVDRSNARSRGQMSDELIPEDIRQFILDHINSIAQLEALVLLRSEPGADWDIATIARRVYIKEAQAKDALDGLCAAGLVIANNDSYRSTAQSAELGDFVVRLLKLYSRHLIPVTNLVHGKPRNPRFADAFKFRKDR